MKFSITSAPVWYLARSTRPCRRGLSSPPAKEGWIRVVGNAYRGLVRVRSLALAGMSAFGPKRTLAALRLAGQSGRDGGAVGDPTKAAYGRRNYSPRGRPRHGGTFS